MFLCAVIPGAKALWPDLVLNEHTQLIRHCAIFDKCKHPAELPPSTSNRRLTLLIKTLTVFNVDCLCLWATMLASP